jgi:hypothetical protein
MTAQTRRIIKASAANVVAVSILVALIAVTAKLLIR